MKTQTNREPGTLSSRAPRLTRLPSRRSAATVIFSTLVLLLLLLWAGTFKVIQHDYQDRMVTVQDRVEAINYAIFTQIEGGIALISLFMDNPAPGERLAASGTTPPVMQALWIDADTGTVIAALRPPDKRSRAAARQAAASGVRSPQFLPLPRAADDGASDPGSDQNGPLWLARAMPKRPGVVQLVMLDQQILAPIMGPLLRQVATLRFYAGETDSIAAEFSGGLRWADTGTPADAIVASHGPGRYGLKVQSTYPLATALEPHGERTRNHIFTALLASLLLMAIALFSLRLVEYLRQYGLHLEMGRMHAEQTSQIKTRFISQISHELRTPLHGIIGHADLIQQESTEPAQRESAAAILQSGEHLLSLVNRLLDAAKIESGKRTETDEDPLTLLPIDLVPMVKQIAFGHDATARSKSLAIYVNAPTRLGVIADRVALGRILHNLLSNALKFTLKGGIRVEVKRLAGTARVEVIDTGIGIAPEDQSLLFGMFVQGNSVDLSRFGGTGLGLYLTKQLIKAMGGEIGFQSTLTAGTTFWFELPLADTEFHAT
jgi:signal transduction histidine kinase